MFVKMKAINSSIQTSRGHEYTYKATIIKCDWYVTRDVHYTLSIGLCNKSVFMIINFI